MTVLAAPLIIAAHVATLPTLPGWVAAGSVPAVTVTEGPRPTREGLREWATIGYVDGDQDPAVTFEAVGDQQTQTRDAGTIACSLITAAGDVPAARARAFALLAAWQQWLTTFRPADVGLLAGSRMHLAADVALTVTRSGGTANARVAIAYQAVTYG